MASVAEIRVFHLEYSDAVATARLIEEMFQEQNQASSSSGRSSRNSANNIFSQMRSLAQSSGGKGGKGSRGGRSTNVQSSSQSSAGGNSVSVTATADERTNSLVVSAPPDTLDVIEELITDLDANPAEGQSIFIYPLKNARADNIKEVLNNLFEEFEGTSTQNIGASSNRRQNNQTTRGNTGAARSGGGGSGRGGKAPLGLGGGFGAGSRGGGRSSARTSTASSADSASINDLAGEVFIEADEDTNSLIIMTSARNYEKVKAILDELDKPVQQVLIKILFAEVTHDDTLELGTDFSYVGTLGRSGQAQILTDLGVTQSNGIIGNIIDNDFEATLRALETDGKLNILSRPYILASNNQTASITVGNEVPFIRDTRTTDTGQTINTIEYEDIGIILEVTPYINPEGLVIMDVNQEISAITGDSVTISQSEDSITAAPVFAKRASENRVIARNTQTVVIGGLMEDRQTEVHKKVPILGSIPILGWLFRSTQIQTVKTELLIFLTPHVVDRDEDLVAITEKEKTANKLVSEMIDQKQNSEDMETTPENNE
jgi:general secretion pathway protein D